jgi:hypothetical protein
MLTPVDIFLLGWYEYHKKQELVKLFDSSFSFGKSVLQPPSKDEIIALLNEQYPKNQELGEYPIG